jgi:hypothetical protein
VQLEPDYISGDAYNSHFVNTGEANSVNSSMIEDGTIAMEDIGQNGASAGYVMQYNGTNWVPVKLGFPAPNYDSEWVFCAQDDTVRLVHGLGGDPDNYLVILDQKDSGTNTLNNIHIGWEKVWMGTHNVERGSYYNQLDASSIRVKRGDNDTAADSIRVRIWIY